MSYSDAAWERAMTVQEVMLKALSGELHWFRAADRSVVIDPAASREVNFGYNTRDLTILAFATLTAGLVVVIRQQMRLPSSGWTVLAPLLAFRLLSDLAGGIQLARRRSNALH